MLLVKVRTTAASPVSSIATLVNPHYGFGRFPSGSGPWESFKVVAVYLIAKCHGS